MIAGLIARTPVIVLFIAGLIARSPKKIQDVNGWITCDARGCQYLEEAIKKNI